MLWILWFLIWTNVLILQPILVKNMVRRVVALVWLLLIWRIVNGWICSQTQCNPLISTIYVSTVLYINIFKFMNFYFNILTYEFLLYQHNNIAHSRISTCLCGKAWNIINVKSNKPYVQATLLLYLLASPSHFTTVSWYLAWDTTIEGSAAGNTVCKRFLLSTI